jgi:hypothetical protein
VLPPLLDKVLLEFSDFLEETLLCELHGHPQRKLWSLSVRQ